MTRHFNNKHLRASRQARKRSASVREIPSKICHRLFTQRCRSAITSSSKSGKNFTPRTSPNHSSASKTQQMAQLCYRTSHSALVSENCEKRREKMHEKEKKRYPDYVQENPNRYPPTSPPCYPLFINFEMYVKREGKDKDNLCLIENQLRK